LNSHKKEKTMKIVTKVFGVLELFLESADEMTLAEISRMARLNKPTTRRICLALVKCGYLRQPVRRGKYSLGWKFLDYSRTIKRTNYLVKVAAPHLMQLKQDANESVTMAVWDGTNTSLCLSYLTDHPLKVVSSEGSKLILHATSIGKAAIAELPENELRMYLGDSPTRYTPNTITDINDLKKHLQVVQQEGVAFDDEEFLPGVRGIGTALRNRDGGVVGTIGILGPTVRLSRAKLRDLVPVIKKCAYKISIELGYTGKSS
jgi:DNA-binding IclR family transcriptional regulator